MAEKKRKSAAQAYRDIFNYPSLEDLYIDYISHSRVVGRDGVRQEQFEQHLQDEMEIILRKVKAQNYQFTRYKPRLASKGPEKAPRVLSIPTIRDRLTLRALNNILADVYPEARTQLPHAFIKSIKDSVGQFSDADSFIRIDLKIFYQTIDHEILLKKLRQRIRKPELINLILQAIKTPTYGRQPKDRGVPEGLSISNILSSIYMINFDKKLSKKYDYYRYVDDILILVSKESSNIVYDEILNDIRKIGLEAHELGSHGKTEIKDIGTGIDYLGFFIQGPHVSVRESSFGKMIQNILKVFTLYKHGKKNVKSENMLIWRLNLKITGCIYKGKRFGSVFFFSQITEKRQLGRLDDFIEKELFKRGIEHISPDVKKFLRAYHEIRFNFDQTNYIPNFDNLSNEAMIKELIEGEGQSREVYERMTTQDLQNHFERFMGKQTRQLEEDLVGVTY